MLLLTLKRGSYIGVQQIRKRCATFSIEHDQPNGTIRKEGWKGKYVYESQDQV
jgi:hypothetical protein